MVVMQCAPCIQTHDILLCVWMNAYSLKKKLSWVFCGWRCRFSQLGCNFSSLWNTPALGWKCSSFSGENSFSVTLLIAIKCALTGERPICYKTPYRSPHSVSHHWVWLCRRTVKYLSLMRRRGNSSAPSYLLDPCEFLAENSWVISQQF